MILLSDDLSGRDHCFTQPGMLTVRSSSAIFLLATTLSLPGVRCTATSQPRTTSLSPRYYALSFFASTITTWITISDGLFSLFLLLPLLRKQQHQSNIGVLRSGTSRANNRNPPHDQTHDYTTQTWPANNSFWLHDRWMDGEHEDLGSTANTSLLFFHACRFTES